MKENHAFISPDFFHCVLILFRSRIRSQPSGARTVNMSRGMSRSSSEVRTKHALAGMKGHSHLVIWVNYKCCRPQGGKMSWTAVSADTHTHTLRIIACIHGLLSPLHPGGHGTKKFTVMAAKKFLSSLHFSFKPFRQI